MSPAGRPEVGTPINIRLGEGLLERVDEYAARNGYKSRAGAIRFILDAALAGCRLDLP